MRSEPDDLVVKVRAEFDPPIEEVRRLLLRPGEVLVAKLDHQMTEAQIDHVQAKLDRLFPDNEVLVLGKGVDLEVVRPEDEP